MNNSKGARNFVSNTQPSSKSIERVSFVKCSFALLERY